MKRILFFTALAVALVGCSKEKRLENRIEGVWNVSELSVSSSGSSGFTYVAEDPGTITFYDDGTGKNDLTYEVDFGSYTYEVDDDTSFEWVNTEETVVMTAETEDGEDSTVWTVVQNDRKTQLWTSVDEDGNHVEILLIKE